MENNESRHVGMKIKAPLIIKDLFSDEDYKSLYDYLYNYNKTDSVYDKTFGRYSFHDPVLDEYSKKLIPIARDIFDSKTLLPSYSLFAHYEGVEANLFKHVDDNACTYTLDMCVYQNEPWDLWVENNSYLLNKNEALAYYGNDLKHLYQALLLLF